MSTTHWVPSSMCASARDLPLHLLVITPPYLCLRAKHARLSAVFSLHAKHQASLWHSSSVCTSTRAQEGTFCTTLLSSWQDQQSVSYKGGKSKGKNASQWERFGIAQVHFAVVLAWHFCKKITCPVNCFCCSNHEKFERRLHPDRCYKNQHVVSKVERPKAKIHRNSSLTTCPRRLRVFWIVHIVCQNIPCILLQKFWLV